MGSLEKVPCIQVDSSNFKILWPHLISAIDSASWIAIDLELSGIGCKRNFGINNVEERYQAFMEVIKSRAILSIGISTFEHVKCVEVTEDKPVTKVAAEDGEWKEDSEEPSQPIEWSYSVKAFNILVKCVESYELEEDAQKFLINHGFDFDRQMSHGVPYSNSPEETDPSEVSVKRLFAEIMVKEKPLVLHNGFIDLLFLYQHLYLNLPKSIQSFIADLMMMFPSGIYDTKYITEKVLSMDSTFLEYVYYNRQRYNVNRMMKSDTHICIYFEEDDAKLFKDWTEVRNMKTRILGENVNNIEVCLDYSRHGWCSDGVDCKKSHNIDLILDRSESKKLRSRSKHGKRSGNRSSKKTRKIIQKMKLLSLFNESIKEGIESDSDECQKDAAQNIATNTADNDHCGDAVIDISAKSETINDSSMPEIMNGDGNNGDVPNKHHEVGRVKSGAHRSGYDAFMTGYAFGTFLYIHCQAEPTINGTLDSKIAGLKDLVNNVFLSGKDHPLKIRSSNYSKPSSESLEKLLLLRKLFKNKTDSNLP